MGIEIESVTTGELALERAFARPPAAICIDTNLSGALDGWQLVVRLKGNPATAHVPVVVCSDEARRATAVTLGAASFVRTPFTAAQAGEALETVLSAERPAVLVVAGDRPSVDWSSRPWRVMAANCSKQLTAWRLSA